MTTPQPSLPIGEPELAAAADAPGPDVPERASGGFIAAFWFAQFANWFALLTPVVVTIALKIAEITTPAEKAAQLGVVLAVGALASTVATPVWGAISDRTTARIGRRKLWMIIGVAGGGIGLATMGLAPNVVVFGLGWMIAQIAFNANQASLNALLPDQIPEAQRGRVSGLLGLTTIVAMLAGTFVTQFTTGSSLLMFLGPWVVTVISLIILMTVFHDRPARPEDIRPYSLREFARTFWVSPRRHPDFAWAFASRFLVFLGNAFIQTYGVYFLTDHLHVGPARIATFVFLSTLVNAVVTVIISVLGGYLSDLFRRRKPFVFIAAVILAVGLVLAGSSNSFGMYLVATGVVALGSGLYYGVDLALAAAVLPDPNNAAKDMGVFQIANALPQSLAPMIAPVFLAIGTAGATGNYVAVFIAGAVFALLGAFAIAPVRGTR
jgi:MFS family permease